MNVTIELSDSGVKFLKNMLRRVSSYSEMSGIEEAVRECIRVAMFDDGEQTAADEGI